MQTWWDFLEEQGIDANVVVGVDEAGRGPLAGPVVVAGVVLPKHHGIEGLNDSKLLTENQREQLFEALIQLEQKNSSVQIAIEIGSARQIDKLGILNCTKRLMKRIVKKTQPKVALLDAVNVDLYNVIQMGLTKGDQRVDCIAAASIIAKVTRDRMMMDLEQKYPGYGLAEHKGYGTVKHRKNLKEKGLSQIHRKSFCASFV